MNSSKKKRNDKPELRLRIVTDAMAAFAQKGIRTVTMDDIAATLSISKRTLYELFHDKEELLLEVVRMHRDETYQYISGIAAKAENVLEIILKIYQKNAEEFQRVNPRFFEDLGKYPKVRAFVLENRTETADAAMEYFRQGIAQGIFLEDINYEIVRVIMAEEIDMLLQSRLCESHSLVDIYETVAFMHLRGISTEKGRQIVDNFVRELRNQS